MLRATLKSLLARKVRLVLSGLAVVLGVLFVSGAFVLTDTLGRSFDAVFADAYDGIDVEVTAQPKVGLGELGGEVAPVPIPADLVKQVGEVPGVAEATGVVLADGARLIGSNGKVVTTFGPPQLGGNWLGVSDLVELREGREPAADDEIVINATLAAAAKVRVGERVGVLTLAPKREFTLVGIFGYSGGRDSIGGANEVAFTEPVAQQLMLGEPGVYSSINIRAADRVEPAALRDRIAADLGSNYRVRTGEEASSSAAAGFKEGLEFFNRILLGFAGVALLVGAFLILNTFSIIVAQRTRELALLRALGAGAGQVIRSVLLEALVIGLFAAVLGLAAGIGVGALLAWLFGQFAGGLPLAGLGVPPAAVISAFAVGVVITLIAALLPAIRAARVPPIAALADVATPDRPLTRLTVAGAVVTVVGAALLGYGLAGDGNLTALFAGVLGCFIGVALLTPLISRPVVGLLGRVFAWSVPGRLGRLNSGRNPRRTAITAAALMVGIALVTGVTVILDSAKLSLAGQAEQSIDAQLVISGSPIGARPSSFDQAVLPQVADLPEVRATLGVYGDLALVDGEQTFVNAVSDLAAVGQIYRNAPDNLADLAPDQVVLSDERATERGLTVGDRITVQLSRSDARDYRVAMILPADALPGAVVLPAAAAEGFVVPQPLLGFVQLTPGTPTERVQPAVEALLADSPEVSVADRSAFIEQQTGQLDTLLQMIQILLALAILIAVLGIVNTLALSVLERTRELGLLRAIGLPRAQTMWMITVEAVVISVFGALLGVLVGTGLGSATVRALRTEGITELVLPWSQLGLMLALAALVGVIAAVLPAVRAARLNVLGAIAHE